MYVYLHGNMPRSKAPKNKTVEGRMLNFVTEKKSVRVTFFPHYRQNVRPLSLPKKRSS